MRQAVAVHARRQQAHKTRSDEKVGDSMKRFIETILLDEVSIYQNAPESSFTCDAARDIALGEQELCLRRALGPAC